MFTSSTGEKQVHEPRPTLNSHEASPEAKALWERVRDITSNEEAWFVVERALVDEFDEGFNLGMDYAIAHRNGDPAVWEAPGVPDHDNLVLPGKE